MLHEVKLAVIGYGGIGSAHTGFIAGGGVAGMTLAAVCDINENRLAVVRERFPGVRCVTDFHDLLDGSIDAVLIAVPIRAIAKSRRNACGRASMCWWKSPLTSPSPRQRRLLLRRRNPAASLR